MDDIIAPPPKKGKTIEQRYQKKTQLEHILLRPDTYIGSTDRHQQQMWVWNKDANKMEYRTIDYVPGFYKIFDEILVNAADIKAREENEKHRTRQKASTIKVTVDKEAKTIQIWNDGEGIPVEVHKDHKVYVPELIFGQLLTSDNYDDSDNRVTGGRNGYGAKLTNIFSSQFTIECADSTRKRKFQCTWNSNMSVKSSAKVKDFSGSGDYVSVKFRPDFGKFHMTDFEDDILSLMYKRALDVAGTTGLKVYLDGVKLPVKDFKSYVDLYLKPSQPEIPLSTSELDSTQMDVENIGDNMENNINNSGIKIEDNRFEEIVKIQDKQHRWEVVVSASDGQFAQVSFVNSICTPKGGTHVTYVVEPMIQAILKKVNAKNKKGMEIKGQHVKHHLWVFVNCLIVNPAFDSQTKETLTTKASSFGSVYVFADKCINLLLKSTIVESVILWATTKEQVELKKKLKSGRGRDRISGIPKLEDANDAGGKFAENCTLILTEGDSAKTSCIAGLSVVGRDKYGVFPLKGKMLNVRDATFSQKCENKEVQAIINILGLQIPDKKGTNVINTPKGLRYGSVMIMTDQDPDGSHIKGLFINLMHYYWPDLLKYPGFLKEFVTPLVKCSKKNEHLEFFTNEEYEAWKSTVDPKGWKIKYYKGLGTSTDREFKEYFSNLNKHKLAFSWEGEEDGQNIDMAFNKNRAADRKTWISNYEDGNYIDHSESLITYTDFIQKELVLFSRYDTVRSIPSIVDGWKPGQRKVLFGVFKRNLKNECKVAQLTGYIAEHSAYHHGETSLQSTIVNMAQSFVGSNNINVLEPCGQFGSRKEGGKDASAARYIFTRMAHTARALFPENDDPLLKYQNEDGYLIEPTFYVPVIPLVLVNGASGIGTGWSCLVPPYNPRDIIDNIYRHLEGQAMIPMTPWYRGFKGTVERNDRSGWDSVGTVTVIDDQTVEVTELPVRRWTQDYKEWLESEMPGTEKKDPLFLDYRDCSSHDEIHFTIKMTPEKLARAESEGLDKVLKLRSTVSLTNLMLFDVNGKIRKYESETDILTDFVPIRLKYYERRKSYLIDKLEREKALLDNRVRFILMVITNELQISNKRRAALVEELVKKGFTKHSEIEASKEKWKQEGENEINAEPTEGEDERDVEIKTEIGVINPKEYEYLLGMPLWSLTKEKVEEINKAKDLKENEIFEVRNTRIERFWTRDLEVLKESLNKQDSFDQENLAESRKLNMKSNTPAWKTQRKTKNEKKLETKVEKKVKKKVDSEDELGISSDDSDVVKKKKTERKEKPEKKEKKEKIENQKSKTIVVKNEQQPPSLSLKERLAASKKTAEQPAVSPKKPWKQSTLGDLFKTTSKPSATTLKSEKIREHIEDIPNNNQHKKLKKMALSSESEEDVICTTHNVVNVDSIDRPKRAAVKKASYVVDSNSESEDDDSVAEESESEEESEASE